MKPKVHNYFKNLYPLFENLERTLLSEGFSRNNKNQYKFLCY